MNETLKIIQNSLKEINEQCYIISSYENNTPLVITLLGKKMLTRKLFIFIYKDKRPVIISHVIDKYFLNENKDEYDVLTYKTYQEMLLLEKECLKDIDTVLMDISEEGLLPRISLADYGTVKYITSLDVEVKSSGDILQIVSSTISKNGFKLMQQASTLNLKIKDEAFNKIKEDILSNGYSDEYEVQQFITKRYKEENMYFDEAPIVAVNKNASNPHYGPTSNVSSKIYKDDVVLIDMWAKMNDSEAIYSDITWMGQVSNTISNVVNERFLILRKAIDKAVYFLNENLKKRKVYGYEVDDIVRGEISKTKYKDYFTHRTGHSIYKDDSPHGPGCNIDDYESKDTRSILKNTAFSLEPGIYYTDFGMRLETDVYIDENYNVILIGSRQDKMIEILK